MSFSVSLRRWERRSVKLATAVGGVVVLSAVLALADSPASKAATKHIGGSVTVWGEWTGPEQQDFEAAITPFETQTGITVNYAGKPSGTMDTATETAVKGGKPPNVAILPDPGTLRILAAEHALVPVSSIIGKERANFSSAWNTLASVKGKQYGVWFKGANKNTIWYNPAEFAAAGITSTPTTWEQLLADAGTLKSAGIPPFSLCTDVGWPVADLWQNLYLKSAGAADYNKLAVHDLKWTDPTVTTAFNLLAELVGQPSYLLGGTQGALNSTYPGCVDKVFPAPGSQPQAAMVIEADFVVNEINANSSNYTAGTKGTGGATCTTDPSKTPCYDFFPFPYPASDSKYSSALQGAGDVATLLKSTPQSRAFIKYIASPQGAAIWAHLGGFTSPNKAVSLSDYPDPVTRADAKELVDAKSFVFSLDDLQGSWEPDLWADMLSVVKTPTAANIAAVEQTMNAQATTAFGH
jgi:ABC-type glycerol-3-phosphate transport system substrate-binding protein